MTDISDCCHSTARIESEPAEPEDEYSQGTQRYAVSRDRLRGPVGGIFSDPRSKQDGANQGQPASHRMDNGRSGKIPHAKSGKPSAAPYPVPRYGIDDSAGYDAVGDVGLELGPLRHSTRYDRGCRRAKDQLEEIFCFQGNDGP